METDATQTERLWDNEAYTSRRENENWKRQYKHAFISHTLQYSDPERQHAYTSKEMIPGGLSEIFTTSDYTRTKLLHDFAYKIILDFPAGTLDPSFDLQLDNPTPTTFHPRRLNAASAMDVYYHHVDLPRIKDALHWFDHIARFQIPHLTHQRYYDTLFGEDTSFAWPKPPSDQEINIRLENTAQPNIPYIGKRHARNLHTTEISGLGNSTIDQTQIVVKLHLDQPHEQTVRATALPINAQKLVYHLLNVENANTRIHWMGNSSARHEGWYQNQYSRKLRNALQLDNHDLWTAYETARLETLFPILKNEHQWPNPRTESRIEDIVQIRSGQQQIGIGNQVLDVYMGHVLYGHK